MTPQFVLRVAGIAFLVISALFAVLAVHYYFSQNIRAVMDDLSGKTRAMGVAGTRRRANAERGKGASRRPSRAASITPEQVDTANKTDGAASEALEVTPMPAMPPIDEEDDMGTVLVAIAPADSNFAEMRAEDGMATVLEADATSGISIPAAPVVTDTGSSAASDALFRITRRVVLIHAQEIIAANEER